jgi:hypothetical protein
MDKSVPKVFVSFSIPTTHLQASSYYQHPDLYLLIVRE